MTLSITYFKQIDDIHFDTSGLTPGCNTINFNITDRADVECTVKTQEDLNHPIDISDLRVTISELNAKFSQIVFPKEGIVYKSTDQFLLFSESITFVSDDEITLKVQIESLEKSVSFTVPRPSQPYPSWVWSNGHWNPPVAYPEDEGSYYSWNETLLTWEEVEM
jgi:hypothetical protein